MHSIQLTINILWPVTGLVLLPLAGYIKGWWQHSRLQNKVMHLEDEMLQNHNHILMLQQQLAQLQKTYSTAGSKAGQVLFLENSKNEHSRQMFRRTSVLTK